MDSFISVLAHDLRNPLATARMSSEIILKLSGNDISTRHAGIIKSSSYRMESMIQNILDFARCQMQLGLELQMEKISDLEKVVKQVIKEKNIIFPNRIFKSNISLKTPIACDSGRIGQLLSNLLDYAEDQAIPETPIKIEVNSKENGLTLNVTHLGNKVINTGSQQIFDPYLQEDGSLKKGVGLGLYVASEIAKAHNGNIEVLSTRKKTSFIFRMNWQ